MGAPVTLKDVAREANCSLMAVSRVMNGKQLNHVGAALQERVRAAARKLNYQSNPAAKALRTGRTKTIGLLIGGISQRAGGCLAEAFMNEAEKHGYRLFITATRYDLEKEREALADMLKHRIDGVIYTLWADAEFAERFRNATCPVLLTENYPELDFDSVCYDLLPGLRGAVSHLEGLGCRRIFLQDGLHNRMRESAGQLPTPPELFSWNPAEGDSAPILEMLLRERPEGLILSSQLLRELREFLARRAPDYRPRLVHFRTLPPDDLQPEADGVIHFPFRPRIERTVETLIRQIEHPAGEKIRVEIPTEFLTADQAEELRQVQLIDTYYSPYR